jgi:hypothetical protein
MDQAIRVLQEKASHNYGNTMDNELQNTTTTSIAVIAIMAALALVGVVVLTVAVTIPLQQQAEARGCPGTTAGFNASKGRCFHP